MSEQIARLEPKRVRAVTTWWMRTGWRARLLGRVGYRWELVAPEKICPCSLLEGCDNGENCMCEDWEYCVDGLAHTPMGSG